MEAMQQSITEALSNSEVAERIWAVESNRFCADCGSPKPDWASINLCVVICKRCAGTHIQRGTDGDPWGPPVLSHPKMCPSWLISLAGEHRGLGPGITKVRSLKMDRKVWTEELIQVVAQTSPRQPFFGGTPCSLCIMELLAVGWGVLQHGRALPS